MFSRLDCVVKTLPISRSRAIPFMKIVLLRDVPKVGKKFEVKEVSDGYAFNRLIPQGLAETAIPKAVKTAEKNMALAEAERKIREDLLLKNLDDLQGVKIEISAKGNDKGHLFAGIHKAEIISEIKNQTRLDVNPENLELKEAIKTAGEHEIKARVGDKIASFKILVKAET